MISTAATEVCKVVDTVEAPRSFTLLVHNNKDRRKENIAGSTKLIKQKPKKGQKFSTTGNNPNVMVRLHFCA